MASLRTARPTMASESNLAALKRPRVTHSTAVSTAAYDDQLTQKTITNIETGYLNNQDTAYVNITGVTTGMETPLVKRLNKVVPTAPNKRNWKTLKLGFIVVPTRRLTLSPRLLLRLYSYQRLCPMRNQLHRPRNPSLQFGVHPLPKPVDRCEPARRDRRSAPSEGTVGNVSTLETVSNRAVDVPTLAVKIAPSCRVSARLPALTEPAASRAASGAIVGPGWYMCSRLVGMQTPLANYAIGEFSVSHGHLDIDSAHSDTRSLVVHHALHDTQFLVIHYALDDMVLSLGDDIRPPLSESTVDGFL